MSIRLASIAGIVLVMAASLSGATKFRPRVNFSKNGGLDQAILASDAFEAGHYDIAIERYRGALAVSPNVASTWFNLGVTYSRTNDYAEASKAFVRASELSSDADYKRAALEMLRYRAYLAQRAGDHAETAKLYEDVIAHGGDDAATLYNLAIAYHNLGREDDSRRMLTRAVKLDPTLAGNGVDEPIEPEKDAGADGAVP
jgi:tetratricopeptide (TPR) repeat protein